MTQPIDTAATLQYKVPTLGYDGAVHDCSMPYERSKCESPWRRFMWLSRLLSPGGKDDRFGEYCAHNGALVMLKVYMDRGEKRDQADGVVTVAAVTFRAEPYRRFRRVWRQMVKKWGAKAFHATDFYSGYGPFWRHNPDNSEHPGRTRWFKQDCRAIPAMVGTNALQLTAVAFRPTEVEEVASDAFKAQYGTSIHALATQILLIINGWWAKDRDYDGGFAYFMETGDQEERQVVADVNRMRQHLETQRHIRVSSFTPIEKGKASGLEAADLLAWHWNKYYMERYRPSMSDAEPRKDLAALVGAAGGNVYATIITGKKLTHLLSRAPLPDGASGLAERYCAATRPGADPVQISP